MTDNGGIFGSRRPNKFNIEVELTSRRHRRLTPLPVRPNWQVRLLRRVARAACGGGRCPDDGGAVAVADFL